jgi:hypothetical protein
VLCLPTVGLKLCHLGSEDWLDAIQPQQSLSGRLARSSSGSSSSGESNGEEGVHRATGTDPNSWDGPRARRLRLLELSKEADRLSQREGLLPASKGGRSAVLPGHLGRHDDYTFFVSRHEENPLRV